MVHFVIPIGSGQWCLAYGPPIFVARRVNEFNFRIGLVLPVNSKWSVGSFILLNRFFLKAPVRQSGLANFKIVELGFGSYSSALLLSLMYLVWVFSKHQLLFSFPWNKNNVVIRAVRSSSSSIKHFDNPHSREGARGGQQRALDLCTVVLERKGGAYGYPEIWIISESTRNLRR